MEDFIKQLTGNSTNKASELESTKFKFYSMGVVAMDIPKAAQQESFYIDVFPIEVLPEEAGDLNVNPPKSLSTTGSDDSFHEYIVNKSPVIKNVRWLALGASNRITPPTVCKGETVMLYNYAGTDNYFWTTMDNELDIRKNEKVTYAFSNKPAIETGGNLLDKCYYFTVDCVDKFIRLFTNKNDGEYTTYEVKINTKQGRVYITDDKGNFIDIDSQKDIVTVNTLKKIHTVTTDTLQDSSNDHTINATNTVNVNTKDTTINSKNTVVVNTTDCTVNADGNVTVSAKGNISGSAEGNIDLSAQGNASLTAQGSASVSAGGGGTMKATGAISVQSPAVTITGGVCALE